MPKPLEKIQTAKSLFRTVKTPCVGICTTGIGDQVCRGCKRFSHEIVNWNGYSNDERLLIAQRLDAFLTQVVSNKLIIVDAGQLLSAIRHQQIAFNEDQNPYCWLFDLLKAGASQISDLALYGVEVQTQWRGVSLVDIKLAIDEDYYTLSSAYYDRYFSVRPSVDPDI